MSDLPPPPSRPDQPGWSPMPTWQVPESAPATPRYASFWQRAVALIIDGVVVGVLALPFVASLFDDVGRAFDRIVSTAQPSNSDTADFVRLFSQIGLRAAVVAFVYALVMIGVWNATVGKFAMGLRVRRTDGSDATWREAALRPILQAVLNLVPGIGIVSLLDYLWMLWDRQKQCLHDKIAGTIVVVVR
jgi:uncharacterized RDD family membrane protein YckC